MIYLRSIMLFISIILINSSYGQQSNNLIAYYTFSGNADDELGNVNGQVSNAFLTTDRFGKDSSAYAFNSESGSVISFGDNFDSFNGTDSKFAFSFWFQRAETSTTRTLIMAKYGNSTCGENQREFYLSINEDSKLQFFYYNTLRIGSYRGVVGSTIITDTNWHHLIINHNGGINSAEGRDRIEMYLDCKKENLSLQYSLGNLGDIQNSSAHFGFGGALNSSGELCSGGEFNFNGKLDELRIFNDVLIVNEFER